jgi:BirA family biotin operon repressor/biotin-[acetyl-CoA-carboxylase] ligase
LGGLLALLVGLAVVEAVGAAGGERLRLKWPNDVVAWDGRKVAGVLVERTADGATLVGIGINLSAPGPEAPAEVRARAAFVGEGGRPTARAILLRHLAARLERLAAEAGERGHGVLLARWRAHAPMLGQPVTVRPTTGGAVLAGIARDVASDGALIVARSDGTEVRVHAGEVTLAPVPP